MIDKVCILIGKLLVLIVCVVCVIMGMVLGSKVV